jgi:hypothetical protein
MAAGISTSPVLVLADDGELGFAAIPADHLRPGQRHELADTKASIVGSRRRRQQKEGGRPPVDAANAEFIVGACNSD